MADYYASTRTNYFAVTDEDKFRQVMAKCVGSGDSVEVFEQHCKSTGVTLFCFGCQSTISGLRVATDEDDDSWDDCDIDAFYEALQGLVVEGDAIIITEVGYEKLRYLAGISTIITHSEIRVVNLRDKALNEARAMLGNSDYDTQMEY